jgi:hypothetical protein
MGIENTPLEMPGKRLMQDTDPVDGDTDLGLNRFNPMGYLWGDSLGAKKRNLKVIGQSLIVLFCF